MQTKKDEIYHKILSTARIEFMKKGYMNTSMRTIAKQSEVSLSNIYNYFKNKDEIFKEILLPAVSALDKIMDYHSSEEYLTIDVFTSPEYLRRQTLIFVELIVKFRDELVILLSQSHGSSLEGYKEKYIERHAQSGLNYIRLMKEKYPYISADFSDFFIHTMSSWWINILEELAMHNINKVELERFVTEYITFATAGWKELMKVK